MSRLSVSRFKKQMKRETWVNFVAMDTEFGESPSRSETVREIQGVDNAVHSVFLTCTILEWLTTSLLWDLTWFWNFEYKNMLMISIRDWCPIVSYEFPRSWVYQLKWTNFTFFCNWSYQNEFITRWFIPSQEFRSDAVVDGSRISIPSVPRTCTFEQFIQFCVFWDCRENSGIWLSTKACTLSMLMMEFDLQKQDKRP